MNKDSTGTSATESLFAAATWFDPIEAELRGRVRGFIETMLEEELAVALGRGCYQRGDGSQAISTQLATAPAFMRSASLRERLSSPRASGPAAGRQSGPPRVARRPSPAQFVHLAGRDAGEPREGRLTDRPRPGGR